MQSWPSVVSCRPLPTAAPLEGGTGSCTLLVSFTVLGLPISLRVKQGIQLLYPTTICISPWPLEPSVHLGGEEMDFHDVQGCHVGYCQPDDLLQEEQDARDQQPLPEVGPVQDEQEPHGVVGQVGPVEHLWGWGISCKSSRPGVEQSQDSGPSSKPGWCPESLATHTLSWGLGWVKG